jgi:diadenosine tetraphosphate (Ap4A) HIT family hydrolase
VAGAQDETAKKAGHTLWQAQTAVKAARDAPYQGSESTATLKEAERVHEAAAKAFNTAYNAYVTSMRAAGQAPKEKSTFII